MPIIFGWGRQTVKSIGVVFKNLCSHCNNEEYWMLTRITTWFTLFFIPIIPYSVNYFLRCPVCKYGLTLDTKQIAQLEPIAETNQLLIDGKISKEEHQVRINQLNNGVPKHIEAESVKTEALGDGNTDPAYCGGCGSQITKDLKFCGNCGTKIPA